MPDTNEQRDAVREARELLSKATPGPWEISGATVIWSPAGHANVAAASDPRPPDNSVVGYYEIRPWSDGEADQRFREACANAELIARAPELIKTLCDELEEARAELKERRKEVLDLEDEVSKNHA